MADPKAPERRFTCDNLTESEFREWLSAHGLHIVTEADKRVLEAVSKMKLVKETTTRPPFVDSVVCRGGGQAVVDAEWQRRTP